jgi:hypothetical protein
MKSEKLVALAAVAAVSLALGCGGEDPPLPPVPGNIAVSFVDPNGTDGAILFTITGPGMTNLVAAGSSLRMFTRLVAPRELRVIVVGNLGNGPLFTMDVPNTNDVSGFTATVTQVADRNDELRGSVAGYSLEFPLPAPTNPSPSLLDPNL